jgi:iron-sulfur cluster assembly protein
MSILNITETAAGRFRDLSSSNAGKALRLSVVGSGCSGNKYDLAFAEGVAPGDERISFEGGELLLDPKSLFAVFGMTIDWVADDFGRRFDFTNPNEAGRCGCGESFHL